MARNKDFINQQERDWEKYARGSLTDQVKDMQGGIPNPDAIEMGDQLPMSELRKMWFNEQMMYNERNYNEQMYNQYSSPQAMIRQYQEAGLNPALMYGQQSAAVGSGVGASGVASAVESNNKPTALSDFEQIQGILSMLTGTANIGANINESIARSTDFRSAKRLKDAQVNNTNVDTELKLIEKDMAEIDREYKRVEKEFSIQSTMQDIENKVKDSYIKDGTVRLQNSQVQMNYQGVSESEQRIVNMITENALKSMEAAQFKELMPIIKQLKEAEVKLTNARTDESRASAQSELSQASRDAAIALKLNEYIEQGGVKEEVRGMRTQRITSIVNCAVGNICNVASTVGDFLPSKIIKTLGGSSKKHKDGSTSWESFEEILNTK